MPYIPFGDYGNEQYIPFLRVEQLIGGRIVGQQIVLAGGTQGVIRSQGYIPGSSGWAIFGDGSAEFASLTITVGFDDVGASATGNNKGLVIASGGTMESSNFLTGIQGWQIDGAGNAEFRQVTVDGIIIADAGSSVDWNYIQNVQIVNADIQDATIQSAKIVSLNANKINAGTFSGFTFVSGTLGGNTIGTTSSPIVAGTNGGFQTAADGSVRWALLGSPANALRFLDASNQVNFSITPGSGEMVFDTAFATDTNLDMTFYVQDRFWVSTMNGGASVRLDVTDISIGMRGDVFLYDGDLEFDTQNNAIRSADGTDVLRINNDGISTENALTVFPSRASVKPAEVTTFAATATWYSTGTTTLWTHGGTNRVVEVTAEARFEWGETAAVAYTGKCRLGVSVDGGSTWSYGTESIHYMGTGTGGCGYRGSGTVFYQAEHASATGDIQMRLEYQVGNTSMDRLHNIHIKGVAEQIF